MNARRWIVVSSLVIVSTVIAGPARGAGLELGAFGSYLDSDDLGAGYGGGVKLELSPISLLSLDGRVSWIQFDDVDVDMVPVELAARLNLPLFGERIEPYVGAGVGYYHFEADGVDLDDNVGFFPLAGLEFGLRHIAFFAEARWLFLQTDVSNAVEELENVNEADIDGLGVNIGLLVRF